MRMPSPAIAGAMASEATALSRSAWLTVAVAVSAACALPASAAPAEPPAGPRMPIFRCIDANGKKITSDRPVRECADMPQSQLNPDGSLNRIVPPTMTDDERAEAERKEREAKVALSERNDAIRRDRNLMQRYPDEAAHRKARAKALDEFDGSVRRYQERITMLTKERKGLREQAEFYGPPPRQPLPSLLKQQIDANETSLKVQFQLVQGQQDEINRINAAYDIELARLRKLWAGAPAGSLGPLPGPRATTAAADLTKAAATK
jgi:hypothetical protein